MNTTDIDGNLIQIGDKVRSTSGECTIQEILSPSTDRFGSLLRVKDKAGQVLDLRVKLSQVRMIVYIDPKSKTTTSKYGV